VKELEKANSDLTRQSDALAGGLGNSRIGGRQIASLAEKLDQALGDFQAKQLAVASEMGIQGEGSSQ
jgi:hypothetical protein